MIKTLRLIPLGGLGEIGKNMLALEYRDDILVIDAGLMFPDEEMLGVDFIIPNVSYLAERRNRVKGIVITHGHEDHTGALPYVLPQIGAPIYCTQLTHGLVSVKLKEHKLRRGVKLNVVQPGQELSLGQFQVTPFRVNHSIPDAVGLAIRTPLGVVIHSGDFKLDHTPVDGRLTDFATLARLGEEGVFLLLSDSTYVEQAGYTPSEKVVGEALDSVLAEAPGRVIVATFASLISRIQQVIDASARAGRRVMVVGQSMVDNVKMALELGYLADPQGVLAPLGEMPRLSPHQITLMVTGSQGEPTSALARMANGDHRIRIQPGDTVVISASAIPGNETVVNRNIDNLFRQGARVLYDKIARVHVHGHGSQEELKMMLSLTRPRFFVPIHGEYRHLALHCQLAQSLGIPPENTFLLEDGDVLKLDERQGRVVGRVPSTNVYVDGLRRWDLSQVELRERQSLARDGIVVVVVMVDKLTSRPVGHPDIIYRGAMAGSEDLQEQCRQEVLRALDHGRGHLAEAGSTQAKVKERLSQFLHERTQRRPLILPVIVEV